MLTFYDPRTEHEFGKVAREGLTSSLLVSSLLVFGLCCTAVGLARLREIVDESLWDPYYPGAALDQVFVCVATISLMVFNVVTTKVFRDSVTRIPYRVLETYVATNSVVLIVVCVLLQPHYMGRLRGYPVPEVADDTNLLLLLTILAILSHQNNHVRWHMMIPAQISCILGYAIPALLFGPDPWVRVLLFTVELTSLIFGASNASRMIEVHERAQFLNLLEEKTRRVQSEFQLSRIMHMSEGAGAARAEEARSVPDSVPTTTETGQLFEINKDLDSQRWESIRCLGRKEQWLLEGTGLSWRVDDILGAGSFVIVVRGYYEGIEVAIKVPKSLPTSGNRSHLVEACNELQILRRLRHENIASFYGAWLDERRNDMALVLELVDGVSLRSFVQACPSNGDRAEVISQISGALHYLHSCHPRVIHGDLKDSNIFVERRRSRNVAKLLDFGLARRVTKRSRPMGGTLLWVAPEVVQKGCAPATTADVFSLGRLVFFIVTGNVPGESVATEKLHMNLMTGVLPTLVWPDEAFAGEYRTWVESCNQPSPASRPEMEELRAAFMHIWETYSAAPRPWRHPMDPDMHKEVQALRKAASAFKMKRSKSNGHNVRGFTLSGQTHRFSLEQTPEDSSTRCTSDATTRLYPDFDLTSVNAQTSLLVPALVRCNFSICSTACCPFHASVQNLRHLVNVLGTKKCGVLSMTAVGQCQRCGAMVTEDDLSVGVITDAQQWHCDLCGEAVRVRSTAPR